MHVCMYIHCTYNYVIGTWALLRDVCLKPSPIYETEYGGNLCLDGNPCLGQTGGVGGVAVDNATFPIRG